jgi:hypothetical protein
MACAGFPGWLGRGSANPMHARASATRSAWGERRSRRGDLGRRSRSPLSLSARLARSIAVAESAWCRVLELARASRSATMPPIPTATSGDHDSRDRHGHPASLPADRRPERRGRRRPPRAQLGLTINLTRHSARAGRIKALGADTDISKSQVSRIRADLDAEVAAFPRPLTSRAGLPACFLGTTYRCLPL